MIRLLRHFLLLLAMLPSLALAQTGAAPAVLVADDVAIEEGGTLVASGNVEALFDDRRL